MKVKEPTQMTDTPETDSWCGWGVGGLEVVPASCARKLERERNAAIAERDALAKALEECREDSIELLGERDSWKAAHDNQVKLKRIISDRPDLKERAKLAAELIEERDGWREAAYALGEALPPSWETLQPPAEQLRKFKEMVALENEKTKKLLDNADKHSKMYP